MALLGGATFLWWILFHHQFQYQYVASYSSTAMPGYYVYAAFWGGQEGTFLLWALITATLGLVLMRVTQSPAPRHDGFLNAAAGDADARHGDARPVPDVPGQTACRSTARV